MVFKNNLLQNYSSMTDELHTEYIFLQQRDKINDIIYFKKKTATKLTLNNKFKKREVH